MQAVGTTYSLDLETLLGIPLALSLCQSMDGAVRENGLHILEGIRRTSSKMAVFCQSGKISVPQEKREVLSLMENSIFQVLPKGDYSFHPKVWVLKYGSKKDAGKCLYKVIVLSRNLTFDRSWDVAVAIDGELTSEEHMENKPVQDFLNYVAGFAASKQKKKEIRALAKEIMQVEFKIDRKEFNEFSFHPLGIQSYLKDTVNLFEEGFQSMFVISPFLSKSTVSLLKEKKSTNSEITLVSRKAELYKLGSELASKIDCWHMKDCVTDGESLLEEQGDTRKQDIHAKVYVKTKNSSTELWLGSANCSNKAFNGNVEFMLKLKASSRYCSTKTLKEDLFGQDEKSNSFERFIFSSVENETEDENTKEAESYIKDLCRTKSEAKVLQNEKDNGRYDLLLSFNKLPELAKQAYVEIYPLLSEGKFQRLKETMVFKELKLAQLGMFYGVRYIVNAEVIKEVVIKINTEDIPESRDSEIFRNIIKNKENFIQYIAFLLGEDYLLAALESGLDKKGEAFMYAGHNFEKPILYEKMLKASSRYPERLDEIKKLMELIEKYNDEIVPEEFKKLYEVFDKNVKRGRRRK